MSLSSLCPIGGITALLRLDVHLRVLQMLRLSRCSPKKKKNAHAGTKTVYFKDPRPFFSMPWLFCLALAVFDVFFYVLHRNEAASKALIQGCKFTRKSAFSQMWWHYKDALEYLVTAGI